MTLRASQRSAAAVAGGLLVAILTSAQPQADLTAACSCSPRSYAFRLLLDGDCASSTLSPESDAGLSNADCRVSSIVSREGGRRDRRDRRRHVMNNDSEDAIVRGNTFVDHADDLFFDRLQSQLRWTPPAPFQLRRAAAVTPAALAPSYVSSIYFFEFDASGDLSVINEDDAYADVNATNGTVISYDSVSQRFDASLPPDERRRRVPGGAGLFLVGNDAHGEAILTGRVAWEFASQDGCEGEPPRLVGETLGWIAFEDVTPASRDSCPANRLYKSAKTSKGSKGFKGFKGSKSYKGSSIYGKSAKSAKKSKWRKHSEIIRWEPV